MLSWLFHPCFYTIYYGLVLLPTPHPEVMVPHGLCAALGFLSLSLDAHGHTRADFPTLPFPRTSTMMRCPIYSSIG